MAITGLTLANSPVAKSAAEAGYLAGAFGLNNAHQLGNGSDNQLTPVGVHAGDTPPQFTAIAAGLYFSIGLMPDGRVAQWGENDQASVDNELDDGPRRPEIVAGLTDIIAIAAGAEHALALRSDNEVFAWGKNQYGQLGDGTQTDRATPVQIAVSGTTTAIAAGQHHSFTMNSINRIQAWGRNHAGQIGDGTTTMRLAPVNIAGVTDAIAIGTGLNHSLAVRSNGTAIAWGDNAGGQLGDNTKTQRLSPVAVSGLTGVAEIDGGASHSIARKSDGTVAAWGNNIIGQLGDDTTTERLTPVAVTGLVGTTAISTFGMHNLAVRTNGSVVAWGSNLEGQLGDGTNNPRDVASVVPNATGTVAAAAGGEHSLLLASPAILRVVTSPAVPAQISVDGSIADTYGVAFMKVFPSTHTVSFSRVEGFTTPATQTPTIASGATTTVTGTFVQRGYLRVTTSPALPSTIYVDGTPRQDWGMWTDVPVGNYMVCFGGVPNFVTPACRLANVTAGQTTHTIGTFASGGPSSDVNLTGSVGENSHGQLGNGTVGTNSNVTKPLATGLGAEAPEYTAVSAGLRHGIGLRRDGTVDAWGDNGAGVLGDGTSTSRTAPVTLSGLSNVVAIASGAFHNVALTATGTVYTWGVNDDGQLGVGDLDPRNVPTLVPGLTGITAVTAGQAHTFGRRSDGTLFGFGRNDSGQLGVGQMVAVRYPSPVEAVLGGVSQIVAGAHHNVAITPNGAVWTWGRNDAGQLGDGTTNASAMPLQVAGLANAAKVAASEAASYAVLTNNTIRSWGANNAGQLGNGSNTPALTPTTVTGFSSPVAQISAAGNHVVVRLTSGDVVAWGSNFTGQLGDGTNTHRSLFTPMTGVTGATAIAAGGGFTLVVAKPAVVRVVSNPSVPTQILLNNAIADTYGISYVKLFPGSHTVSYSRVEGFTTASSSTQTFVGGVTTEVTGNFAQRGYLRVLTLPATAGTVYVNGSPRQDWGMWTDVPTGTYSVCFGNVAGLTTPACQTVSVTAGQTNTVTGTYA